MMPLFPGRFAYYLILAFAAVDIAWVSLTSIQFPLRQLVMPLINIALLAISVFLTSRVRYSSDRSRFIFERFGYLMQGMIFLQASWIVVRVLNHVSMSTDLPYADDLLSHLDGYLGIEWMTYFEFVQSSSALILVLDASYWSLTGLSFVSFLGLMLLPDIRRARFFLETFFVTAIICTAAGMFFPAKAAVATYLGNLPEFANFDSPPGLYHLSILERLREESGIVLDLANMPGLVTFPSFHTAAGIILAASFWRTGLFWIVTAYSVVMIAATPVFGGHYFVDLIGGAIVAYAVLAVFASLRYYEGLFRRRDAAPAGATADLTL